MESAISATELNLDNLTLIVDCNGFQNDGKIGTKMSHADILKNGKDLVGIQFLVMDIIFLTF